MSIKQSPFLSDPFDREPNRLIDETALIIGSDNDTELNLNVVEPAHSNVKTNQAKWQSANVK